MASEISEFPRITDSNQDVRLDEILRILREIEVVLSRFRPLLDQVITSPVATRRAMRRVVRDRPPIPPDLLERARHAISQDSDR